MKSNCLATTENDRPISIRPFWTNKRDLKVTNRGGRKNTLWNNDWQFSRKLIDPKKLKCLIPTGEQIFFQIFDLRRRRFLAQFPNKINTYTSETAKGDGSHF